MRHDTSDPAIRERVRAGLAAVEQEMVGFLRGLVNIPTENPPGREYERCADYLGGWLERLGYHVEYPTIPPDQLDTLAPHGMGLPRVSVLAVRPGSRPRPVLHYNGHYDVVPAGNGWTVDPFGGEIRDGRIYGRGVSDMKGGIAAAIYAVEALRRAGFTLTGTVEHSLVPDEESTGNRNAGTGFLVEQGYISPTTTSAWATAGPSRAPSRRSDGRPTARCPSAASTRSRRWRWPWPPSNASSSRACASGAPASTLFPRARRGRA